ncbi:DUF975 family protein [Butyrivibrio sp. FC2001]|uniref:DUF975 family protein n=1 Tax=Butyrivibrio sp. FC2001 TaxID=1280671 RepID=UPI0003F4FB9D|nr:DUF975 family protein [Butyrivibrio sp. FC2001]
MWTNSMLKQNGMANFTKNRWACVVVCLILGIATGGGSGSVGSNVGRNAGGSSSNGSLDFNNIDWDVLIPIIMAVMAVLLVVLVIGLVLKIAVFAPLEVGCQRFFIVNRVQEKAQINNVAFGFKTNWKNIVKVMFFKNLYLFFWGLLCGIPAIIKGYSYRLVPYLLAENPDMTADEAITLSRQMMNGQKMNAFVYDLSFLGWILLSALTCGILYIFYVGPYKKCSDAELYTAIKETYNPQAVM